MIYNMYKNCCYNNCYCSNNNCCNNTRCCCTCSTAQLQQQIACICQNEYEYFLNKENVVGIGCGYKVTNGFMTCQLCIQVFVENKISDFNLSPNDMIPPIYKGIRTDVIQSGIFTTSSLTQKIRPVEGGFCVNSLASDTSYGTVGCLVTDGRKQYLLSSNHALANGNTVPIGTQIVQPSTNYGGTSKDTVANLTAFIPLKSTKETNKPPVNVVDCAIGMLAAPGILSSNIHYIGKLKGVKKPHLSDSVQKVGSITELTTGKISTISATITIQGRGGVEYLFKDQILTNKMSGDGDSGSILLDMQNYGIGLLSADAASHSVYGVLDTVLKLLKVHLV